MKSTIASHSRFNVKHNSEIRFAKTSAIIIGVYIFCWSPTLIKFYVAVFTDFGDSSYFVLLSHFARDISNLAAHFNSALNPIIYAYRIASIRKGIKTIFKLGQCGEIEFSEDQRSPEASNRAG